MRRSGKLLLSHALRSCRLAVAGQQPGVCAAGVTASSSATNLANGARQLTSSALHRSAVLPRLLDTLSDTYQQSKQRMDGLLEQMTAELEKVPAGLCFVVAECVQAIPVGIASVTLEHSQNCKCS